MKILMVCLGNICRSPVAEGIMLDLIKKHQLKLEVDSAGTAGYHVNEPPDPRTIRNARKYGVDLSNLRARKFVPSDFDQFDQIYVMDESNLREVQRMAKNQQHRQKVKLLLEVIGRKEPVPDPYYGSEEDFDLVFKLVSEACEKIAQSYLSH